MTDSVPAVCPSCGRANEGQASCSGCGLPLAQKSAEPPKEYPDLGGGTKLPTAGRSGQAFASPPAPIPAAPERPSLRAAPPEPLLPTGIEYILRSAFSIIFLLVLAAAATLLFVYHRQSERPAVVVPRLTETYLSALAGADFDSAYDFFSHGARSHCTITEFRQLRGGDIWIVKNIKPVRIEPDSVVVSYDWSTPSREPITVYMLWAKEEGRWVVPYNLNLLKGVEAAVASNNPDVALLDSQEAVRVNPRDPIARASYCEAAFFRKFYEQALPECRTTLELASKYPSNISPERLRHVQMLVSRLEKGS